MNKISFYKRSYLVLLGLLSTTILEILASSRYPVFAQSNIIPDDTLGSESSIVVPLDSGGLPIDAISGGATRGSNLFHSFKEFNVGEGRSSYFLNNDNNLQNILTRVTGNNPSNILGTLGILKPTGITSNPNLYLINPNGIVFGENASLDVGGSFVATTADGIEFGEQGFFSATNLEQSSLLSVAPGALFFQQVANQKTNSIESQAFLTVPNDKSLLLLGGNIFPNAESAGNIVLNGGRLRASGGRVEIGGLGEPGKVDLNTIDNQLSLGFPEDIERVDVSLLNAAEIDVTAGGSGDISIYARNLDILEGSDICAGIGADQACGGLNLNNGSVDAQAGDIILDATEKITIANPVSEVYNDVNPGAIGNSGDINITGKSIEINHGGRISATTYGEGNAGSINIFGEDTVSVKGSDRNSSFILNNVGLNGFDAIGDTGGINIVTGSIFVTGAQIQTRIFGQGNTGKVKIDARDNITFDGEGINDDILTMISSGIEKNGEGKSGGIELNANSVFIANRAQLSSNTEGKRTEKSGDILIKAKNQVSLINSIIISEITEGSGEGNAGNIEITAENLYLKDGSSLLADTENEGNAGDIKLKVNNEIILEGEGPAALNRNQIVPSQITATIDFNGVGEGGDITISTGTLLVNDEAFIRTDNFGQGNAGDIKITAASNVSLTARGEISADTTGEGSAGDITIDTKTLSVNDSQISSTTFNTGNAGNLTVRASELVELSGEILRQDGTIASPGGLLAQVNQDTGKGKGGDLTIETGRLSVSNGSKVQVATFGEGDAGNLFIQADEIDIFNTSNADNRFSTGIFAGVLLDSRSVRIPKGNGGNLTIETDRLNINNRGKVSADTDGIGDAGDIDIMARGQVFLDGQGSEISSSVNVGAIGDGGDINVRAESLSISNDAQTSAESRGQGSSGNIKIDLEGALNANNGSILTSAEQSSGGAINITAKDIRLFDDSDIRTNVFNGTGGGGNINLTANTIVAVDDSDILSFARDGKGGDITFNTEGFFSTPLYRPSSPTANATTLQALNNNSRVDVNASGTVNGAVTGVPDVTFIDDELTDLPDSQIDTNTLIANSCISRGTKRQENSFIITGAGALRNSPGDGFISKYSTGDVRNVSEDNQSSEWKKGEPIIEPQGVYKLASGELILSRECK